MASKKTTSTAPKNALVIVESPTKAKTIRKFLPKEYVVEASMGHIRDLPQSAMDIPLDIKKEEWARIGVNYGKDFEPIYVVPKGKFKIIQELKRKLKDADILYLATDEDREGESISWHLLEVLKPKIPIKRMVFHEITKPAIQKALEETRELDISLVRAQETRRILDRLFGYTLSPLIWKKIAYGLSAGRVQSVGLRMIVGREKERIRFKKSIYWDLTATMSDHKESANPFDSKLISVDGKRLATGKDFDETTGNLKEGKDLLLIEEKPAAELRRKLENAAYKVESIEEKEFSSKPFPPFITSSLQQEANRKLGLSAREAMRVAQSLYEEGLITYMRTDSPSLSKEAVAAARRDVEIRYGKEYLSPEVKIYTSKSKGAQEAHEAIRPAGVDFVHPKETGLSGIQLAMYELIWKRTVACQMADARKLSLTLKIGAEGCIFQASGTRVIFPGYLRAYVEGSDDPEASLEEREVILPAVRQGQTIFAQEVKPQIHETKPPARFTEASLIQLLEKEGIGRPSTYASIIETILDRGYVRKVANALVPSFTGFAVMQLLERDFAGLVDYKFTSHMEDSLDEIASGKLEWLPYLRSFYLGDKGLQAVVKVKDKEINAEQSRSIHFDHLPGIDVRVGQYGAYIVKPGPDGATRKVAPVELDAKGKPIKKPRAKKLDDDDSGEIRANIPDDLSPADLSLEKMEELIEMAKKGPEPIGPDPKTGLPIYLKVGRFGPYVQLGEVTDEQPKPKRASIPPGYDPKNLSLVDAIKIIALPRELGPHPDSGVTVLANLGRFGPYVQHQKDYRSLKKTDDLFTITYDRAMELLREEKKGRRGAEVVKELGAHPEDKEPVKIMDGKYGPYVNWGKINATIPKDLLVDTVTLEKAVELLKERQAMAPAPKRGARGGGGRAAPKKKKK